MLSDIIQTQKWSGIYSLSYMDSNFELECLYLNGITSRQQKTFKVLEGFLSKQVINTGSMK